MANKTKPIEGSIYARAYPNKRFLNPDPVCNVREFAVRRVATSFHLAHAAALEGEG